MSIRKICFDACAWNAILNNEPGPHLADLKTIVGHFDTGKVQLLVPAIVIAEVAASPNADAAAAFFSAIGRDNAQKVDITENVAIRSGRLRRQALNDGIRIKTPDALIIAAAELSGAELLITLDDGILRLNGRYFIPNTICLPADYWPPTMFD